MNLIVETFQNLARISPDAKVDALGCVALSGFKDAFNSLAPEEAERIFLRCDLRSLYKPICFAMRKAWVSNRLLGQERDLKMGCEHYPSEHQGARLFFIKEVLQELPASNA